MTDNVDDVFTCSGMLYDSDGPVLSLSVYANDIFETRSQGAATRFRKENNSYYCSDIEAEYEARYPFTKMSGEWHPCGDDSGYHYFTIDGEGVWCEWFDQGSDELGTLTENGDGVYISYGKNYGEMKTFEFVDGYLYIDGIQYERY